MASFGRFLDTWVVDRVLFEFVNQGGCSCCGISHGGMGMQDFMALCSDLDTDDDRREKNSPWPPFMQDEVWSDRVKFRKTLKVDLEKYEKRNSSEGENFVSWWLGLNVSDKKRILVMPLEELRIQLNTAYDFKPSYRMVLCTVMEQLQHFEDTRYPADGATDCEKYFEESLYIEKRAWRIRDEMITSETGNDMFIGMMLQLSGPHLLPRTKSTGEDSEGAQSFRSDRRLLRLLIFRYFADQVWRKFIKSTQTGEATEQSFASLKLNGKEEE